MKIFDLTLQAKGFDINKARATLKRIQKINGSDYAAYINKQKKDIVSYHLKNNEFYKSKAKNISSDNWETIPVMTKADLQKPLESLLSSTYKIKDVYVDKTSGASGHPFYFSKDKFCHALTWAEIMDRFSWYNIDFNTSKQARFYGIPLDKKGYLKERLKDILSNRFRFSVFDLSDKAFEKCLLKFSTAKFEYINGYTSSIVQFAKFLKKNNIVLTHICPSLKYCFVTSEMLFDSDRALLTKYLGVPIINEYGASELDLIAFENPDGQFQINSETLFIEVLNDNDKPVPLGESGRLVITSLYNRAQPFIRYDIGDTGILSSESTLKHPILEKLIGRTNDIAILPSGKKAAGLTFYYVTKSIIEDSGNVKEFVIEQIKPDNFSIIYTSELPLDTQEKKKVVNAMTTYLEPGITISFVRVDELQRAAGGKLKQFVSKIN